MGKLSLTLLTCLLILSPNVVLGEKLTFGDLEERNGLFYEKSSNVPFSGKVSGVLKGERWTRFFQGEFTKGKIVPALSASDSKCQR